MSAGEITGNSGSVISTTVPIALSGNALISGDEGVPDIILDDYDSYINVSGLLNNIEELTIDLDSYKEGIKILAGSPLTENVISKFRIYDTNYGIYNNGYTKYIGEGNVYYIHKDGDDNAIGTTSEQPLRTIEGALEKIGAAPGTIILTSDIDVEELIIICSDITVKTDGNDRIIESKMIDGSGECLFVVNEGKLTLGDTEQTTGELIIRNDAYICHTL